MDVGAVRWIHGAIDCERSADPPLQVVAIDDDTHVIRQSKCSNFEAPFLILLLGTERALLHDTGATADADEFPIRRAVDELLGGRRLELLVTHSHGHGDHHAGDAQFDDLPAGSIAPIGVSEVAGFFGLEGWPAGCATLDLGDRPIDVIPSPGHLDDHVVLFDRTRGLLLSGDTLLPGTQIVPDNFLVRLRGDDLNYSRFQEGMAALRDPSFWGDQDHWDGIFESLPGYRLSKFQPLMPPWVEREVVGSYLLDVDGTEKWLNSDSTVR